MISLLFLPSIMEAVYPLVRKQKRSMRLEIIRLSKGITFLAILSFLFASPVFSQIDSAAVAGMDGKALFDANCASCHAPYPDQIVAAPSLAGVTKRWPSRELLYVWVKNPNKALATGDPYVTKMVAEYKPKFGMMAAQNVDDNQIEAILQYLETNPTPLVVTGGGGAAAGGGAVEEESDTWLWMLIMVGVLAIIIFTAAGVKRQLLSVQAREAGEELEDNTYAESLKTILWNNKKTFTVIMLVFVFFGVRDIWYTLKDVGVYGGKEDRTENYAPEQPIDFPHDLHAGLNEINCEYCHHSASKSKHAGIPSLNICMNCHVHVKEGSRSGTEEIAKIYEAIDWDPDAREYGDNPKPVKWVKVHNLPDHVYFNHSQHVVVGGIECQTCHGPVEEMEVVEQYSALTMGWCINCHNETAVQTDNGYYKEMHDRLSAEDLRRMLDDGNVTAREMGGWECAKCHY